MFSFSTHKQADVMSCIKDSKIIAGSLGQTLNRQIIRQVELLSSQSEDSPVLQLSSIFPPVLCCVVFCVVCLSRLVYLP